MSNKHDANVRKSTWLNFQIGLVASLLFAFVMFEMYTTVPVVNTREPIEPPEETPYVWNEQFKVYKEPKSKTIAVKKSKPIVEPEEIKVIDNNAMEELGKELKTEITESKPIAPGSIEEVEPEEEPEFFDFKVIENVPVFPGCEKLKSNKERADCFSKKIGRIVSRRFNTELGQQYGLSGKQIIYTQFDVDHNGSITNVRIRAPHPRLEKEAKRVIGFIPQVTPGKQRGKAVTVKYNLPIVFQIQD